MSRKKVWEVVKATTKEGFDSVHTGKRELKFGTTGAMTLLDGGEAKEVQDRYGVGKGGTGEVVVMEVDDRKDLVGEDGHKYTFHFAGAPWADYDELGRRVRNGEEKEVQKEVDLGGDQETGSTEEEARSEKG